MTLGKLTLLVVVLLFAIWVAPVVIQTPIDVKVKNNSTMSIENAQYVTWNGYFSSMIDSLAEVEAAIEENGARRRRAITKTMHVTIDNQHDDAIKGWDSTSGLMRNLSVDENGRLLVDLENASIQAGDLTIGLDSGTDSVTCVLPTGDNNIGNVDVFSLPELPMGDNNIGNVDVLSLPAVTLDGAELNTRVLDNSTDSVACVIDSLDVTSLPALPAGDNNIGNVDVVTLPELPTGDNNIGNVDVLSLPAITLDGAELNTRALDNTTDSVACVIDGLDVTSLPELSAGDNNIGNVDVISLPELPAGDNNIGNVDVVTLPELPTGDNNIGNVDVLSLPAITLDGAELNTRALDNTTDSVACVIDGLDVTSLPELPAGDNNIGNVDVVTLPELPAGDNNIGNVDVVSLPALPEGTNNIGSVTLGGDNVNASIAETDQAFLTSSVLKGKESDDTYHTIKSNHYGGLHTVITNQNFEFQTSSLDITIRADATYGFVPSNFREYTASTGSTEADQNGHLVCETGTGFYGYGAIQSFRTISYAQGLKGHVDFGAAFNVTDDVVEAGVGLLGIGDELSFGYATNQEFGIWYRHNGLAEVQILTVTVASTGPETIEITIDGTNYSVLLSGSSDTAFDAYEIANTLTTEAGSLFSAEQVGSTVEVAFKSDGDKTGDFDLFSDVMDGTWTTVKDGVTKTSEHVAMSEWDNQDLGFTLDPEAGNHYAIRFIGGYGQANFYVQGPVTSDEWVHVHTIHHENTATDVIVGNPDFRIGMYVVNIGGSASDTSLVKVPFIVGGVVGHINHQTRNPRAATNTVTSLTASSSVFTNILTLKNRYMYNHRANSVLLYPKLLTLANDASKTAIFEIRGNPTVSGATDFQEVGTNLVSLIDTSENTVTGGRPLGYFTVAGDSSIVVDLETLAITVPPTLRLVIAGRIISGEADDLTASIVWYEHV